MTILNVSFKTFKPQINAQNKGGATALQYAVINGNEYLVEILTSHASIDVNIQNNEGYRPIDYCGNHPAIQKILELQIFKSKINVRLFYL